MNDHRLPATYVPDSDAGSAAHLRGVAVLSQIASDLEAAEPQPAPPSTATGDMEQALARFRSLERENGELRELARKLTERAEGDSRAHAQEALRLGDQITFLQSQATNLQQQRDTFANYAIEVKTRMTNLTTVMASSAEHVEHAIDQTMGEIRDFVDARVSSLSALLLANAKTASKLVDEALQVAKDETIVRLQNERQAS